MSVSNIAEGASSDKTETSPLKENAIRKCFCPFFLCGIETDNYSSLKTIIVTLFGTTAAITLALLAQVYHGVPQIHKHGSVSSDSYECSQIGLETLRNGGSAIDAAISTTICLGVVSFHITGLGGGGYLMLYNHRKRYVTDVIDFHETVPESYVTRNLHPPQDGFMVGVPGFLKGMWEAHKKYGKLSWEDLIMPSSNLAKNGFRISQSLLSAASSVKSYSYNANLVGLIKSLQEGQNISLPELSSTLQVIAVKGAEEFYNGQLAKSIVYSVKLANGNMSLNDLSNYEIYRSGILKTRIANFDIFVPDSSSGGPLLLNSLDSIEILDLNESIDSPAEIILKMSDILHDTYVSFLQKTDAFPEQPEPIATQVSVVDGEENYVTVVSGLGTWFGSQILTDTGFILNNALVRGGFNREGRPVSLASPVVIIQSDDICGKRFVLGSGDVIAAAQVITNLLIFNRNVSIGIESPRFNIENRPRHLTLEGAHVPQFSPQSLAPLRQLLTIKNVPPPYKSINIIEKSFDSVFPYADSRGGGKPAQF